MLKLNNPILIFILLCTTILLGMNRGSIARRMAQNASISTPAFKSQWYTSHFTPCNESARRVLTTGQILNDGEEPSCMIERVVNTIADAEINHPGLNSSRLNDTDIFARKLGEYMDEGAIVMSTPILTNAGRFHERPLSACTMPPVNLREDLAKIREIVNKYHEDGMGTGFNLSDCDDPVAMLQYLNEIANVGARSKREQRPVGNMAILDVDSPYIEEFIRAKVGSDERGENWIFNISVNVTKEFMHAVEADKPFTLRDGKEISARALLQQMAEGAYQCGDPGLLSLERLNRDNPTPRVSEYRSTAPCAEVGLAPGETCIFGYLNLAQFLDHDTQRINFDKLQDAIRVLTRSLDNVLETSIENYTYPQSKVIMRAKRKIGIGICGFADLLATMNLSYRSQEARDLLEDLLNYINFHSKVDSVELATYRGSFGAIEESRYMDESFIMDRFGAKSTQSVSSEEWSRLAFVIAETKLLRNSSTTALPPTGRSAMVIGASQAFEPFFSLKTPEGINQRLLQHLKRYRLSRKARDIQKLEKTGCASHILGDDHPFLTATELSPEDHLAMACTAQGLIDESLSKTVNLPENTTPEEIAALYLKAYKAGLKGISVFRNGSRIIQPQALSENRLPS